MAKLKGCILHCVDSRGIGGIETHILEVTRALAAEGFPTAILFLRHYGVHPLESKLNDAGIPFFYASGLAGFAEIAGFLGKVRELSPLLLHTHGYKANILGRFIGAVMSIPTIASFHAGEKATGKLALYQALDAFTARWSPKIAISEQIADHLSGDVAIIDNFMPPDDANARLADKHCIFLGRLSVEKGPDRIITLAHRRPDIKFTVYGDGPMRESLMAQAPRNVSFPGATASARDALLEGSLLIMPSRYEGLPMAALEAMAVGLPIAAFGVGALPRLIENDVSGFLTPPNDEVRLGTAIDRFFCLDLEARRKMGKAAKSRLQSNFSPAAQLPRLLTVYKRACGRYKKGGMSIAPAA